LEERGCEHFKAFGTRGFEFPSSDAMPTLSKTVDAITKIVLRNFWMKSGREYARKKATDQLAKVRPFILLCLVSIDFGLFLTSIFEVLNTFPF
jgi:hypothetical protein